MHGGSSRSGRGPSPQGSPGRETDSYSIVLHSQPTSDVTGSVQDLALWAWTRGGTVDVSGEPASRDALDALIAQGIQ